MIFVGMFCLTVTKKNVGEAFCVSFNFEYRKNFSLRGVFHDILSNIFCLIVPKTILHESLSVSLISGIEFSPALEGCVMIFCRNFLSHSTKKFHRDTILCFRNFLVSKKLMDKMGGWCQDFLSEIFCGTVPKKFVGESFSVSRISVIEKFFA